MPPGASAGGATSDRRPPADDHCHGPKRQYEFVFGALESDSDRRRLSGSPLPVAPGQIGAAGLMGNRESGPIGGTHNGLPAVPCDSEMVPAGGMIASHRGQRRRSLQSGRNRGLRKLPRGSARLDAVCTMEAKQPVMAIAAREIATAPRKGSGRLAMAG